MSISSLAGSCSSRKLQIADCELPPATGYLFGADMCGGQLANRHCAGEPSRLSLDFYREKLAGLKVRKKLRLRRYNGKGLS